MYYSSNPRLPPGQRLCQGPEATTPSCPFTLDHQGENQLPVAVKGTPRASASTFVRWSDAQSSPQETTSTFRRTGFGVQLGHLLAALQSGIPTFPGLSVLIYKTGPRALSAEGSEGVTGLTPESHYQDRPARRKCSTMS